MAPAESLDDLVHRIYDAAVQPALWQEFLQALSHTLASESSVFHLQRLGWEQQGRVVAAVGVDERAQRSYDEYYASVNVWTRRGGQMLREGAVLTGEMVCPNSEVERSEYYTDYLRPLGLFHSLASIASADKDTVLIVSCLRSKALGTFDEDALGIVRALTPHLKRAAHIHRRLSDVDLLAHAQARALDVLPMGVLLFDGRIRLLMANQRARDVVRAADGLTLDRGAPNAHLPAEAAKLKALLARAVGRVDGSRTGGVMRVSRTSGREPYEVLVIPLTAPMDGLRPWGEPSAAVFVVDTADHGPVDTDVLRELYGLTASEVRVAAALAAGLRVEEIADQRHLTRESIRWLVKQVLHKTGARTQAQAVIRILAGTSPLRRGGDGHGR